MKEGTYNSNEQPVSDEEGRTTPHGLFNYAEAYWQSAVALQRANVRLGQAHAPVWFLYFHAIELYLKAYLRSHGHSAKELRDKLGHRISRITDAAKEHGLTFDDEDEVVLKLMADTNHVTASRYIRTGYFTLPSHEALNRTCHSLHQSVGRTLKARGFPVRIHTEAP